MHCSVRYGDSDGYISVVDFWVLTRQLAHVMHAVAIVPDINIIIIVYTLLYFQFWRAKRAGVIFPAMLGSY